MAAATPGVIAPSARREPRDLDGLEDAAVAGAAAQVAGDRLAHREVGRRRVAVEQVVHRHDEAGRAEPALHRAGLDERALHVGHRAAFVGLQPFDGHDLGADGRRREHEARAHEHAVDEHRARAALALLAAGLRARQPEPLAQHVEQALTEPRRRPDARRR